MVSSRRLTGEDIMFTNILLPVDGSRASLAAARHGLAKSLSAK